MHWCGGGDDGVWEGLGGWSHNANNRTISQIQGKRAVRAAQWVNVSRKRVSRVLPYPSCSYHYSHRAINFFRAARRTKVFPKYSETYCVVAIE